MRVLASMIPISGSFEAAEEVLQDAFLKALKVWPQTGIPRNPGAWLTTVARRQAIDARRRASFTELLPPAVENIIPAVSEPALAGKEESMPDDRLRLLFTCCHPALNQDARIALTLRTLGASPLPRLRAPSCFPRLLWPSAWFGRSARFAMQVSPAGFPLWKCRPSVLPPCNRSST